MNLLDIGLILIVVLITASGVRRGFIIGMYELCLALVAFLLAARFYRPVADSIGNFIDARQAFLNLAAFIIVIIFFQSVAWLTIGPVVRYFRKATGIIPGSRLLDRIAGVVPGFIQGILAVTLVVLLLGAIPTTSKPDSVLDRSTVGLQLYRQSSNFVLNTITAAGLNLSDFVALTPRSGGDGYLLPFTVTEGLHQNSDDEHAMFAMVNQERDIAGLPPLEFDESLAQVGRAHGIEMFNEGYFDHHSPITGTPFDRIGAAGIEYGLAGENLALAPNVEIAHNGLMDSPGHRANILEPGFRKIGIGAISSDRHGTMYVQVFTD